MTSRTSCCHDDFSQETPPPAAGVWRAAATDCKKCPTRSQVILKCRELIGYKSIDSKNVFLAFLHVWPSACREFTHLHRDRSRYITACSLRAAATCSWKIRPRRLKPDFSEEIIMLRKMLGSNLRLLNSQVCGFGALMSF